MSAPRVEPARADRKRYGPAPTRATVSGYDAVLFDNDGVLVTPPRRETQAAAARAAFESVGVADPDPDHVDELCDGVTVERLGEICDAAGVETEAFWTARERRDQDSQIAAFERGDRDVYDDVDVLADLSVPLGVVSNNHHTTVAFVLEFHGLGDRFETYYGREMTVESLRRRKPETHYLDRAAVDLGVAPEETLYVGDSRGDVVGATEAGMDSAFVRRRHTDPGALDVEPTHAVDGLDELPSLVGV